MGNVFKERFENIWNGNRYMTLRQEFKTGQRPFSVCKTCIPKDMFDLMQITSRLLPKGSSFV
jgi:hypothetical protein